jgi:thiamine kinase-like enzyme
MQLPADLLLALQTIPVLAASSPAANPQSAGAQSTWRIERLGGVTNRNYRLRRDFGAGPAGDLSADDFVLRLPGAGTSSYLNRPAGLHNAALAAEIGIAPVVVFSDVERGWQLSRYLADCRSLSADDLHDPATLAAIGALLGQLQRAGGAFQHDMRPFAISDRYLTLAPEPDLLRLRQQAKSIELEVEAGQVKRVPAHIDANPTNFLQAPDGTLHLIDWEFSAMADPCWDLATIVIEGALSSDEIATLLRAAGHVPDKAFLRRIDLFRCALCLVASTWAYVEIGAGNADPDLRVFAEQRRDAFAAWLAVLAAS